jgi:cytochrome c-type biogenesis protein CcmH
MGFWIAATLLTGLVCLLLLRALARRPASGRADPDVLFYNAQLAEIERQHALGLIGPAEKRAAEAEAGRRLLAVAQPAAPIEGSNRPERLASIGVLLLVPVIAFGTYAVFGSPDKPDMQLASRAQPAQSAGVPDDLMEAVRQIEARLQRQPDGRGFEVLAPVYLRMGRFNDAVSAWAQAIRLSGETAERFANHGEALVFAAGGVVSAAAVKSFETAVRLDAMQPKARTFLAMAAEQDGDTTLALSRLDSLAADLPDSELKKQITARAAALRGVPQGGEAIASAPANEQMAMIRGMVDQLSNRLATAGGSAEEWSRLVRSLAVLGETDRATAVLNEARQKFADRPVDLAVIEQAAGALSGTRPVP